MRKIVSVVLIQLIIMNCSLAQECNEESLLKKAGSWKPGMKGSEGGTATELAKEKKLLETIHTMIKSKYTPTAVEAIYHGAYSAYPNMPGNGYTYSIIPLNYYCDGKATQVAHETSSEFLINANLCEMEIYESYSLEGLSFGTGYHYIKDLPVQKDGYWYFNEIDAGLGFGMKGKSRSWLITYDGKLPFAYVSKKEFLETRKVILKNAEAESARQFKDVLERLEIEKGFKEKEYKNDPEKLNHYMKMDYNDSKARYEKFLAENEKKFKPAFAKIESSLKMPAAELNQQAIVKMDPNDGLSYLFTDDDDPMGEILIKPNPGYFNKKLPRSSPQFFWIYVRANHKDPIAAKFMADIMKAVDFAVLKNMLGH